MPLGSTHEEVGLLTKEGSWLIIKRDDGGRWRLHADYDAERFLGRRVRVRWRFDVDNMVEWFLGRRVRIEGIRSSFDLLAVRSCSRAVDLALPS